MRQRVLNAFVIAAFCSVFFGWVFYQSYATHQIYEQTRCYAAAQEKQNVKCNSLAERLSLKDWTDIGLFAFNGFLAVFTFCLVWIGYTQKRHFERTEKAFVFPTRFIPLWEPYGAGQWAWRFQPIWLNSGNTPTRKLKIHAYCALFNTELPDAFDFDADAPFNVRGTSGLMGPHFESAGGMAPNFGKAPIIPQDILDVQGKAKFLYLIGWARYNDVFPGTKEHITRFCWQILPQGNPLTFIPNDPNNPLTFPYLHTHRGNCADEECET